jgi:hypothetical protein
MESTADIRAKMLQLWKLVDENKISAAEVRLHIGIARVILDTLKVEMTAAHLSQASIPPVMVRPALLKQVHGKRN